jgi:hypothetical protein
MGTGTRNDIVNNFNIYKMIGESDSPNALLSKLADSLVPIRTSMIRADMRTLGEKDENKVYKNYLDYFIELRYWGDKTDG